MARSIVHMDMDTFFVSCEKLMDSSLNNIPIIVGGGDRGVFASCSYEARYYGVKSAMPMKQALWLCPDAKVIHGDFDLYSKMSSTVTEIIEEHAPVMEKASIDEFYLDVTGMDRFHGTYKWTNELAQRITKETGLPLSFALSVNKTVSKIATGEGKPNFKRQGNNLEVPYDRVKPFLNPLSIRKIPGIGQATFTDLSKLGIRSIQNLSEMPQELLQQLIGKDGLTLWKKANGIDDRPVQPYSERKSIGTDQTFDQDSIDISKMKALLSKMVEGLTFKLRAEQWLTSTIVVKIKYSDFNTKTLQSKISYTSADHTLIQKGLELFDTLFDRRLRVRMIGVKLTGLVHGTYQLDMFEKTDKLMNLYQAMDKMKTMYGSEAVTRCAGTNLRKSK